jgi:hypothetical protein
MAKVDTQLLTRQNKNTGANSRFAKPGVSCFHDGEVLKIPALAKRQNVSGNTTKTRHEIGEDKAK